MAGQKVYHVVSEDLVCPHYLLHHQVLRRVMFHSLLHHSAGHWVQVLRYANSVLPLADGGGMHEGEHEQMANMSVHQIH